MNLEDVSILVKLFDLLFTHMYDGEGEVAWPKHLYNFLFMIYEEDEFTNKHVSLLLTYTLHESPFRCVLNLPADTCTHVSTSVILLKTHFIILI